MQLNGGLSARASVESRIPEPRSIQDTELTMGFLADLALKLIYYQDGLNSVEIAEALTLPFFGVIERVLDFLKRDQLVEISGSKGLGEQGYQWAISRKGRERAVEALERDQYIGPAPVPLERYNEMVLCQSMGDLLVGPKEVREALAHLVIRPELIDRLGPAVNSGRSLFLYGPSGNGKTAIAKSIIRMLGGSVYIPYTVIVDGHIIRLFDEVNHKRTEDSPVDGRGRNAAARGSDRTDPRWIKIRRPEISVGGELTMPSLDLIYDPVSKTYEAPFQMKANTGLFVIDDFGRQAMRPQNLLNRWIVPLELRVDFLTLHTGKKIEIPFDQLIVFSTNLDPRDLVDEAFLRRIRHKLLIDFPDQAVYCEILERECAVHNMDLPPEAFDYLMQKHYLAKNRSLRACHPRDILDQIVDISSFRGTRPVLSKPLIDAACDSYFAEL